MKGSFGTPRESKAKALVRAFAESYIEKAEDSFEGFEAVYRAYEQLVGSVNPDKINRETFLLTLKECVVDVKYAIDRLPGEEQFVHRLYNIRLVKQAGKTA